MKRGIPINGTLNEGILCDDPQDFFDYSTNLHGHFKLEHNFITLIGERKKYFGSYWDFKERVDVPVFKQDFIIDNLKAPPTNW